MRLARLRGTVRRQRHDSEGPSSFRKISKWVDVTTRAVGVRFGQYTQFSKLSSHRVRLFEMGSSSDRVPPALVSTRTADHGALTEPRTASGMPNHRCFRVLHVPDVEHRDRSLVPNVLRGSQPRSSSAAQPSGLGCSVGSVGGAISARVRKEFGSTISLANTWLRFS